MSGSFARVFASMGFVFGFTAWAGSSVADAPIQVYSPHGEIKAADLGSGFREADTDGPKKGPELPSLATQEQLFEKAGLANEIRGMDSLDRDLLYWRARHESIEKLHKRYPSIGEGKLRRLKGAISNGGR